MYVNLGRNIHTLRFNSDAELRCWANNRYPYEPARGMAYLASLELARRAVLRRAYLAGTRYA